MCVNASIFYYRRYPLTLSPVSVSYWPPGPCVSTKTCHYSGEMELTMLKRFCMAQNIRTLLSRVPPELEDIGDIFAEAFDSDGRGTLQNEIGSHMDSEVIFTNFKRFSRLKPELYRLLSCLSDVPSDRALMQTHFDLRRVLPMVKCE